ncbi:hypothetical protein Q5P01_012225 [Channa striata]|uniref:Uncharacterized protein n=1 Tax=Channa striata TaxID=64152 RepID=A0AA88MPE8_CHASR|nr:hypothetical protein Q5P01_012225 [Channa striata]
MAYNEELFDCSVCLQLMEDPVTTACGHSYCIKCINSVWDRTNHRGTFSCPQCRQTFCPRPELKRNTLLADLLEQHRKKNSQNETDGNTYASPGDAQCDACTGRKRKACKSCLVCLASYCETHLQPHFEMAPLQKHILIPASARINESICGHHGRLLEVYCHTDQQFICLMCVMDQHKGHKTVTVAAEKCEMQRQLTRTKEDISDRLLNAERKISKLRDAAGSIKESAWEVCDDFEQLCAEHICFVKRKCSEMREKVGDAEKAGVDWTNSSLTQLQREVLELRRREDKLDRLSLTEDPIQFLKASQALGNLPVFTDSHDKPDTLTEFVNAQKHNFQNIYNKAKSEILIHSENNKLLNIPVKERSRGYLLAAYRKSEVQVNPCTVAAHLWLSDSNRQISCSDEDQGHPDHPDRFTYYPQALCTKGLEDNHYWEVEWDGGIVDLAVSYIGIKRKGSWNDCCFGHNDLSWKLTCTPSGCTFWHNNLHKGQIPPALSRRVGMHLNFKAGMLSFYSVSASDQLTLLHQIRTTFTEPLYPGFSVDLGATLNICNI